MAATAGGDTGGIASARNRVRSVLTSDGVGDRLEALVEELLDRPGTDAALAQAAAAGAV